VSTVTACVVAGAGIPVAKHGGRSVSSASGSADVLAALGVVLEMPRRAAERALAEGGLAFLFAPAYHPAMLAVAPLRRALGVRTVFNLAGPLANPVRVSRQLVGVDRPERIAVVAGALRSRGLARAWVVSNEVAGDELLPFGKTRVTALEGSSVRSFELSAGDFGLPECAPSDLAGGGPEENAAILTRILAGETGPRRNAVLMNAAAALVVAGATDHLRDGVARAAESIDTGRAARALATLVERSREAA
ncbi:MAG: anthranilate phosphoribosyltransferase, partial [Acidobacteria bacterium]|nr:anthranilate phosphoribosyltransferase [Acidobacteriota bacterium]